MFLSSLNSTVSSRLILEGERLRGILKLQVVNENCGGPEL